MYWNVYQVDTAALALGERFGITPLPVALWCRREAMTDDMTDRPPVSPPSPTRPIAGHRLTNDKPP